MANELSFISKSQETIQEKIEQMSESFGQLEKKYEKMKENMQKKISMAEHKEELEKVIKTNRKDIKVVVEENRCLKAKCGKVNAEKESIGVKIPNLTSERAQLTRKLNFLEKELKQAVPKLKQYVRKAEEACNHEQVTNYYVLHRYTCYVSNLASPL